MSICHAVRLLVGRHRVLTHHQRTLKTVSLVVDIATCAGGIATSLAFVGGVWIAARYGSRANASVSAVSYEVDGGAIVVVRPSVSAVGAFRLNFADDRGAFVLVTEVWRVAQGITDGRFWQQEAIFESQFVEPGETLMTSIAFPVESPLPSLVGWRVSFGLQAARWPRRSDRVWAWSDRAFVPAPRIAAGSGGDSR